MTAQQLQHMSAWEGKGEASLLRRLPSPLFKTTLHWPPSAVAMVLGCSGNWQTHTVTGRETVGWCHLNWGRKDTIISFFFSFSNHLWLLASRVLVVKNSHSQTPCQYLILLRGADNEQAYEFSTMAAALGCQETTEDTKEGVGEEWVIIEIMAIKNSVAVHSHSSKRAASLSSLFYCRREA